MSGGGGAAPQGGSNPTRSHTRESIAARRPARGHAIPGRRPLMYAVVKGKHLKMLEGEGGLGCSRS